MTSVVSAADSQSLFVRAPNQPLIHEADWTLQIRSGLLTTRLSSMRYPRSVLVSLPCHGARTPLWEEAELRLNRLISLLRVAGIASPRVVCTS